MARWPGYRKWQHALLTAVLLSVSVTAQALGVGTPEVMSGFSEPLKARVALLNTGNLHADDIRVSLADNARWQAMEVVRSADTDTLRLAVDGRPGHLYLDVRGSRPLATPWLDVVVTLRWPQGELTPQLTLLPSAAGNQKTTPVATSPARSQSAPSREASVADAMRERSDSAPARDASNAAAERSRMAALEARLSQLEQQLQDAQTAQSATLSELAALRVQPADQTLSDEAEWQALTSRQQKLESRLDQLDQKVTAADVAMPESVTADSAPESAMAKAVPEPEIMPREAAVTPVPEPAVTDRDHGFVWTWLLAALLMVLAGMWAGLRRWRQQRYRLVSVAELSPSGGTGQERAVADGDMDNEHGTADNSVTDEVWTARRAQVEAICSEAEVFYRHNRYDHAITMLKEGLEHYPNDIQLMRALAAMEAARDREQAQGEHHIARQKPSVSAAVEETPGLAPVWSLTTLSSDDAPVESSAVDDTTYHASRVTCERGTDPVVEPSVGFPGSWALEEVASGGFDADNECPDADRLLRHV
ncbi:hypothetical protein SAMN05421848_0470 [Kushneria avicenniae]|uniref:FimV N-terminal domain-containing protein n=1 Tax=Kushneria avicenniae TaxID=402385 RepID=A0A1I1G8Y7_9GAMM|nr:hypothetical protein [Kushneria avicenniae]SFC08197.1 hypothetical protein SAMN05421848_0470 [Kushneria avicenniae]